MELFKYTRIEHENSLVQRGCIRLGTLFDYRKSDLHGGQIGDPREGTITYAGEFEQVTHELISDHPAFEGLIKLGAGATIGSLSIKNYTRSAGDLFVFSTSLNFSLDVLTHWHNDPKARYDTCYRIHSARLFFRAISKALSGRAEFLGYVPVTYYDDSKSIDLASPLSRLHPAQLKGGTNYDHQTEVRAFWLPLETGQIEPLDLEVPGLQNYISHVHALPAA